MGSFCELAKKRKTQYISVDLTDETIKIDEHAWEGNARKPLHKTR